MPELKMRGLFIPAVQQAMCRLVLQLSPEGPQPNLADLRPDRHRLVSPPQLVSARQEQAFHSKMWKWLTEYELTACPALTRTSSSSSLRSASLMYLTCCVVRVTRAV